ncbi:MAG TPA: ATP-binding protein [Kofleriaceae bacterium]|nr:ATP-binding protein [Kofleriaceae bacterium]
MSLYARAALGVIAAFLLTYIALALIKAFYVDPWRREIYHELERPALEAAARELGAAGDEEQVLGDLRARFGRPIAIERLGRDERSGWFVRGGDLFGFAAIDDQRDLVSGPLPAIDPGQWIPSAVALGLPLVLAGVVSFLVVGPLIRRLRALARVAEELAAGDLAARAPEAAGRDAIATLARRFNQTAAELERILESKRELLRAVSHEFRTPTARMRFELEMLADADDEERRRRIESIDEGLDELDELVDELLDYARFDGGHPDLQMTAIDVGEVARQIVGEIAGLRQEVEFRVSADGCAIEGNPKMFRRALRNLMLNAARYAERRVDVTAQPGDGAVVIEVVDDGPGIPADQRQRVFEPFARIEGSRGRQHGGAGLGLSIVERICQWHGAGVEVAGSAAGARLVMRWPPAR